MRLVARMLCSSRIAWRYRRAVCLASGLAAALAAIPMALAAGQASDRQHTLFVSALDSHGTPIAGLGPDAFIVREDRVRREILSVTPTDEPIDIALLIDNSEPTGDRIPFIREAVKRFIAAMSTADSNIALVALAHRPTVLADYTSDLQTLTTRAGWLFAIPSTEATLLDAISQVSAGLRGRETRRTAVVAIVLDGPEMTYRRSKDVVAALKSAQAPLHLITVGQFFDYDSQALRERAFLLADGPRGSGGQRIALLTPNRLADAASRVARELKSQYEIVYSRPASPAPPSRIEIASAHAGITVRGAPEHGTGDRLGGPEGGRDK